MPEYRFYKIAISGNIAGPAISHDASDDKKAIEAGKNLNTGGDIEIWQGPRLVAYRTQIARRQFCGMMFFHNLPLCEFSDRIESTVFIQIISAK